MPTTRGNLAQTPINSDTFNLTADLATMADSLEVIVPVANDAAGDTVAAARAAAGFAVTDARPLFTYNNATRTIRVKGTAGWSDMNGPLGLVYLNQVTTTSGAIGALTVVQNIASFNFVGFRRYQIVWDPSYQVSGLGALFYLQIGTCLTTDGAAVTTGVTALNGRTKGGIVGASMTQHSGPIIAEYKPFVTGAVQIKFMAQRVVGTSETITIMGNGTGESADYKIYDMGAVI
jgi:hypothetical protein